MKNRILSALLAAALTLSLCACSAKYFPAANADNQGQAMAASVQPPQPGSGASSTPDASGTDAAAGFERARLWDDALDAVIADFAALSGQSVLGGGQNAVFSPASVYITLGTITDGAGGATFDQLMDVLGASSPGDAIPYREVDDIFWNADNYAGFSYTGTGAGAFFADEEDEAGEAEEEWTPALQLANSVWLGQGRTFRDSFATNANVNWYAEVFDEVPFGTPEGDAAFNTWVGEATGGKVDAAYQTTDDTALLAASAAYLRDGWLDPFQQYQTAPASFTLADGTTVEVPFMHQTYRGNGYNHQETYDQTVLFLSGGAEMNFVLPAEGTTLEDLLADPAALSAMLRHRYEKYADVAVSLPQFQFTSSPPVAEGVKAMGATDAFDKELADFSGMLAKDAPAGQGLYLSNLQHEACIGVNENGVEAAAVTIAEMAPTIGADTPDSSVVEFTLDRPFLFFIRYQGLPLFMGVVNNPAPAEAPSA